MAEGASRAGTKLTISAGSGDGVTTFSGFVISKRDSCHIGRTVALYEQVGRTRNLKRDEKIGIDQATPNGDGSQYFIDTEEGGKFYAYVKQTRTCKAAFSKSVSSVEDDGIEE